MKKLFLFAVVLLAVGYAIAQTFSPPVLTMGAPIATSVAQCPLSPVNAASLCPVQTASGVTWYTSGNGGPYVPLDAPSSGGVLSVNGKKPDATGNVALSATTTSSTTLQ